MSSAVEPVNPEIPPTVSASAGVKDINEPAEDHVFRSKLPNIQISNHLPLHAYCFENLGRFEENPCLISGSTCRVFSYAETYVICRKMAAGLARLGVKKGDVIMLLLHNCPEFVFSFLAASMIGAVLTTANPFYTSTEIFKQFEAAKAKLIVTQVQYVDKLRDNDKNFRLNEDLTVVPIDDPQENCLHFTVLPEGDEEDVTENEIATDENDAVTMPFSSETTGLPKGVVLTHKSLITGVAQQVDGENPNLYLTADDVVLCVLLLFHIYSLSSVLLCSLRAGARMLLMQKFEIRALLELIQWHRVSGAAVVSQLVLALANNPMVDQSDLSSF